MADTYSFDTVSRRRQLASLKAPKASWDVPQEQDAAAEPTTDYAGGYEQGGGGFASSGDSMLDFVRNQAMSDAGARTLGLRYAARSASPNDPSLAAFAGLSGQLVGQGDAARSLNRGALDYAAQEKARKWQEYILRLQHEWQQESERRAAQAALYSGIGQLGGVALGAAF